MDVIHSDLSNLSRTEAVNRFRTGDTWVLIATDLLGRGLDFLNLNTVVNYDFPQVGARRGGHAEWSGLHPSDRTDGPCGAKRKGDYFFYGGRQADAAIHRECDEDQRV